MKRYLFTFLLIIFFSFPMVVFGVDSNLQLDIPQFKFTYINDYLDTYTCKYRLNLSPETMFQGSFDFTVNISKLGKVSSINVTQASKESELTYDFANKITVKDSISTLPSYMYGYDCPSLMAYLTVDENNNDGYKNVVATFDVRVWDSSQYNKYKGVKGMSDRYYELHEYEQIKYNCKYDNEQDCKNNTYCKWYFTHEGAWMCIEPEYGKSESKPPENTMRTESCSGYYEKIFNQTIEYSFAVDGTLSANISSGDFFPGWGSVNWIDKDKKLWELWKQGKCCANDMLGVDGDVINEKVTLSCDGTESSWDFEDDNESMDSDSGGTYNPGDVIDENCKIIPDKLRDWINDALNLLKYLSLALVVVLGVLDFIKAAASGEADAMKKAGNSFLKRIIAVVILFLVPVIVDLVLNLVDIYGADSTCLPK